MFNSPREYPLRRIIDKLGITKPPTSLATLSSDKLDKNIPAHYAQLLAMQENLDADNHVKKQQVKIIGNNLPELMCFNKVEFSFQDKLWLVHTDSYRFPSSSQIRIPTSIANYPVCVFPKPTFQQPDYQVSICCDFVVCDDIDPNRILPDETVKYIMKAFPKAIGVRIHPWRFVDVMYARKADIKDDFEFQQQKRVWIDQIGGHLFDVKVENFESDRFEKLGKFPDGMSEDDLVGNVSILYRFDRQSFKIERFPVVRK